MKKILIFIIPILLFCAAPLPIITTIIPTTAQAAQHVTESQFLLAAATGDLKVVKKYLNQTGAEVDVKDDEYGWTALIWAVYWDHKDIVELLLENHADINATDNDGWTALMVAAHEGEKDIVELLLKHGADTSIKVMGEKFKGKTALDIAKAQGYTEIVELLEKAAKNTKSASQTTKSSKQNTLQQCLQNRKGSVEGQACCYFPTAYKWKNGHCICPSNIGGTFTKVNSTGNPLKDWQCIKGETLPPYVSPFEVLCKNTGGEWKGGKCTCPGETIWKIDKGCVEPFKCSEADIALLQKWAEKYGDNDTIIHRIGELLEYCNGTNLDETKFDTLWAALSSMINDSEAAKVNAAREASRACVKESASRLDNWIDDFKANTTVWKNEEGKFNTTRLLSDTAAAVVLGTTGGLVTSKVMKKNQIKKGFENIHCTVGGQEVANWGDEFQVGVH